LNEIGSAVCEMKACERARTVRSSVLTKVECKGAMFVIKKDHKETMLAINIDYEEAIFVRYSSLNNKSLGCCEKGRLRRKVGQ
jgi:hypothetical protein